MLKKSCIDFLTTIRSINSQKPGLTYPDQKAMKPNVAKPQRNRLTLKLIVWMI